jgi:ribosomal protein S2
MAATPIHVAIPVGVFIDIDCAPVYVGVVIPGENAALDADVPDA